MKFLIKQVQQLINTRFFTLLVSFAFLTLLYLLSWEYITSNDFWWQLALGKYTFETGMVMHHDIYSYTFNGALFNNPHWGFDVIMYAIFKWFSYEGLNIFRFIIFLLTYLFIYKASTIKKHPEPILVLALFTFSLAIQRYFMRPEIAAPLFSVLFIWVLFAYKYKKSKLIYLLPPLVVVWVNSNGGYLFGPVITGIFFGAEALRHIIRNYKHNFKTLINNRYVNILGIITIANVAALFVSSYGLKMYDWILLHFISSESSAEALRGITEWDPTDLNTLFGVALHHFSVYNVVLWVSVALIATICIRQLRRNTSIQKKLLALPYEDIGILLLGMYVSLSHQRFHYLFVLFGSIIILRNTHVWKKVLQSRTLATVYAIIAIAFLFTLKSERIQLSSGPKPFQYPAETVEFIKRNNLSGPLLNYYNDGGYLIWNLYPHTQVFIDGRTPNLYTGQFFWQYQRVSNTNLFASLDQEYQFNIILYPNNNELTKKLYADDNWKLIYFDEKDSLFIRDTEQNAKIIDAEMYSVLAPWINKDDYIPMCDNTDQKQQLYTELEKKYAEIPHPLYVDIVLSNVLIECNGDPESLARAITILKSYVNITGSEFSAPYYLLGTAYINSEQELNAITAFTRSVAIQPNAGGYTGLGIAYHNLGEYETARKYFKKALRASGNLPNEFYQIYGRVNNQLGNFPRALELFQSYQLLTPEEELTSQDYLDISYAYEGVGNPEAALKYRSIGTESEQ